MGPIDRNAFIQRVRQEDVTDATINDLNQILRDRSIQPRDRLTFLENVTNALADNNMRLQRDAANNNATHQERINNLVQNINNIRAIISPQNPGQMQSLEDSVTNLFDAVKQQQKEISDLKANNAALTERLRQYELKIITDKQNKWNSKWLKLRLGGSAGLIGQGIVGIGSSLFTFGLGGVVAAGTIGITMSEIEKRKTHIFRKIWRWKQIGSYVRNQHLTINEAKKRL